MFDIQKFLIYHKIPYRTSGKNVAKNHIVISCPYCKRSGHPDPEMHMGIDLKTGKYGCWWSPLHRGNNLAYLIRLLINCSLEEAERLVKNRTLETENELLSLVDSLFANEIKIDKKTKKYLQLPSEFIPIHNVGVTKKFYDYIENRSEFEKRDIYKVIEHYELRCCLTGKWKDRIIIPIYYKNKLATWQGRTIHANTDLKYKDLSIEDSVRHSKHCLYNYDEIIKGGSTLFVTEGVFDAIKLDFYFPATNRATCLFTKTITDEQIFLMQRLSKKYENVMIFLDANALAQTLEVAGKLAFLGNVKPLLLSRWKDPASIPSDKIKDMSFLGG